jgi:hypothetical protein
MTYRSLINPIEKRGRICKVAVQPLSNKRNLRGWLFEEVSWKGLLCLLSMALYHISLSGIYVQTLLWLLEIDQEATISLISKDLGSQLYAYLTCQKAIVGWIIPNIIILN